MHFFGTPASPHFQLQMTVWSLEALVLFFFTVSSSSASASKDHHHHHHHRGGRRDYISFGRLPVSWPAARHASPCRVQSTASTPSTDADTTIKSAANHGQLVPVDRTIASRYENADDVGNVGPCGQSVSAFRRRRTTTTTLYTDSPPLMEDLVLTGDDSASHAAVQNQYPDQKQQLWQRPTLWRRRLMTANPNTGRMNQLVSASDTLPPFLRPLDFTKKENAESSALFEETATDSQTQNEIDESDFVLSAITQPLIPERAWQALTGREFQDHPELLEKLAAMGEAVARDDSSRGGEWIEWHAYGSSSSSSSPDVTKSLQEGDIHVWTGKCVSANTKSDAGNNNPLQQQYFGAQLPVIKTRSIIPLSVHDMVELLLDSSRVQLYNPWSLGRRDCWVAVATAGTLDAASLIVTKIVKNRVQPPLGSKAMVSTTLLHARPALSNDGSWVLVSRSLGHHGSALFSDSQNDDETAGRSDILLGVNLLEPVSDDSCILTAVTHVHSAAVPTLLAERLGVQSAIKFVKDMRRLKQAANLTAARSGEPSSATDRNEPSAINS